MRRPTDEPDPIFHAPHGAGIVLGKLDPLSGGGLVLKAALPDRKRAELVDQPVGKSIGGDTHGKGLSLGSRRWDGGYRFKLITVSNISSTVVIKRAEA